MKIRKKYRKFVNQKNKDWHHYKKGFWYIIKAEPKGKWGFIVAKRRGVYGLMFTINYVIIATNYDTRRDAVRLAKSAIDYLVRIKPKSYSYCMGYNVMRLDGDAIRANHRKEDANAL